MTDEDDPLHRFASSRLRSSFLCTLPVVVIGSASMNSISRGYSYGARRPRNNPEWPEVGIFAQRAKGRPNRLGSTIVSVLGVDGRQLRVAELDAVEGTPILDIKPVMVEFLPRTSVRQPAWSHELMRQYWLKK